MDALVCSTCVIPYAGRLPAQWVKASLAAWLAAGVRKLVLIGPASSDRLPEGEIKIVRIPVGQPFNGESWREALMEVSTPVVFCINGDAGVLASPGGLRRMAAVVTDVGASMLYGHYREQTAEGMVEHPTIDYQLGSLRDGFDFGPVVAFNTAAIREAEKRWGPLADTTCGALYDLRLRLSAISLPVRLPEVLYTCRPEERTAGQQHFDYVDPRNREAQLELEAIVTAHLARIGAKLEPRFEHPSANGQRFPVEASVVIPVRNREKTIADAVHSALQQKAPFDYNVIVVDNHSTDGTTAVLRQLAAREPRLVHLIPEATDLLIGGCWSLAASSEACGRVAVQLDSDDLYSSPDTLRLIVEKIDEGPYAMVVGSYKVVNFNLEDLPPGLIDHREWTRDNGRNNLLRVNGLGAPRAFLTERLRAHPFPNVSYGEDYYMGLRLSRHYDIGRIYESLYLCRRWEGNTDSNLPLAARNAHDTYKDRLRTLEVLARQQANLDRGAAR